MAGPGTAKVSNRGFKRRRGEGSKGACCFPANLVLFGIELLDIGDVERRGEFESIVNAEVKRLMYFAVIGCGVDAGVAAEWSVGYLT
jgi:hypothetical protein